MKQLALIYIIFWGFMHPATAQIMITNSVFPAVGDTLRYTFGNQPGGINNVFTPPGGNQHWELSNLHSTQFLNQIMKNPQTGIASSSFPASSSLFNPLNSSFEVYWQVAGNQVKELGYWGHDQQGLGMNLLFLNSPLVQELPYIPSSSFLIQSYFLRPPGSHIN